MRILEKNLHQTIGEQLASQASNLCAPQPERNREIPDVIGHLYNYSEILSEAVARMESRLSPVLRSVPPADAKKARPVMGSPLANELADIQARLELTISAVHQIIDRIEV